MPIFFKNINTLKDSSSVMFKRYKSINNLDRIRVLNVYNSNINGLSSDIRNKKAKIVNQDLKKDSLILKIILKNFINVFIVMMLVLTFICFITNRYKLSLILLIISFVVILFKTLIDYKFYKINKSLFYKLESKYFVYINNLSSKSLNYDELLVGDVIHVHCGDMIPADSYILEGNNFSVNNSLFTGSDNEKNDDSDIFSLKNICLMGATVTSGDAKLLVIASGSSSYISNLDYLYNNIDSTDYNFYFVLSLFMICFITSSILTILLYKYLSKDLINYFMFFVTLSIGIASLVLQFVTNNSYLNILNKFNNKVNLKHFNSITKLNDVKRIFINDDLLISDSNLYKYIDYKGHKVNQVFNDSYLFSYFNPVNKSRIDKAILDYEKVDVDYNLVQFENGKMILKNDDDYKLIVRDHNVIDICNKVYTSDGAKKLDKTIKVSLLEKVKKYESDGLEVYMIAVKNTKKLPLLEDVKNMTFMGFVIFQNIIDKDVIKNIKVLKKCDIDVKIFTELNDNIINKLLNNNCIVESNDVDRNNDIMLLDLINNNDIFINLSSLQKRRVVELSRKNIKVLYFASKNNDILGSKFADVVVSYGNIGILKEFCDFLLLKNDFNLILDLLSIKNSVK